MKEKLLQAALIAALITTAFACKKNDDLAMTKAEILTSRDWQLFKQEYDDLSDALPPEDEFPYFDNCEKDDYIQFLAGGSGFAHEGPTKCDASDPDKAPFTWQLLDNDNKLSVSPLVFTVITLNEQQLTLELTFGTDKTILYYRKK